MNRLLMASTIFALVASAAQAAPSLSGASVSQSGTARAESEAKPFLSWVEKVVISKLKGGATAPVAKGKRPQTPEANPECEESKKAEQEKQAEAKPGLQAGPEPMYLAF